MALLDIQAQLQQLAQSGSLTLAQVGNTIPEFNLALDAVPLGPPVQLPAPQITLDTNKNQLTVQGAGQWGILKNVGFTIIVSPDDSRPTSYIVSLDVQLPASAKLSIPGIDWFDLGSAGVHFATYSYALYQTDLIHDVDLALTAIMHIYHDGQTTDIPIKIEMPSSAELVLVLNTAAIELPSINDILSVFGSTRGRIALPPKIDEITNFSLQQLQVAFDPTASAVSALSVQIGKSAQASEGWTIIPGVLTLDSYTLGLGVTDPLGTPSADGLLAAGGMLGNTRLDVYALHPASGGWQLRGEIQNVPIGDILDDIATQFSVTLPAVLRQFNLQDFVITFDTATGQTDCTLLLAFSIAEQALDLTAGLSLVKGSDGKYQPPTVTGTLAVGSSTFMVRFDDTAGTSTFTGTWQGAALKFADIADAFALNNVPVIPPSLDLDLVGAGLTYDFTSSMLVMEANSSNYGKTAFVMYKNGQQQKQFFFGATVALAINLADLPLVGKVLDGSSTLAMNKIQIIVASDAIDAGQAASINALIPADYPTVPATGISAGASISALAQVGEAAVPLAAPLEPDGGAAPSGGAAPGTTTAGSTTWITLQRAFGPVYFNRVGMQYQDGTLLFLLDATLTLAGLTLSLDGLGFGAALSDFRPTFTLRGLGLQYVSGPVAISGSFLSYTKMVDGQAIVEYDGGALIKTEALTLSAFGSYSNYQGHPSLFIYAVLDYPLGGPAFFYVTGLTAGFGYNRALNLPPIDQVAQFPLITAAVTPGSVTNTQAMMVKLAQANAVPPSVGTDFFALGVKFTSFKLVDSFALLTIALGTQVEIGLLGLATLIAPVPEVAKAVPPLAEVQMAIKASFIPAQGFLGLAAQLTPASFILERACHLTGGYAFYAWFAPSPHDGDFVQTLGGYHPRFAPPPHYPVVPRVGVNWQVTPQLTLKGSAYFALTASLLMAGGAYQITWESGNFKAWYNFAADFLVGWKPFHYDASARVDIGASYTFHSKILGTHRISVDVGADMHVWGPEFSGLAHVDLHIISFDITFGAGAAARPAAIAWAGDDTSFTRSFLPDAGVCSVTITGGLIDTASVPDPQTKAQDTIWLVNPKDFRLVTNSLIPAKGANRKVADTGSSGDFAALPHNGATTFGVAPMDLHAGDLNTTHSIAITRDGAFVSGDFQYTPILKQVPAALWGESMTPVLNGPAFVQNTLAGFTVTPAQPPDPGVSVQVDQAVLAAAPQTVSGAYRWTDQVPAFTPDTQDDATRRKTIDAALTSAAPVRQAILQALGIDPGQVRLNSELAEVFVISPEIPA